MNGPYHKSCFPKSIFQYNFQKEKGDFGLKIDFENWKYSFFDSSDLSWLKRCQKILWGGSLGCKTLLNSISLTIKLQNRHHAKVRSEVISNQVKYIEKDKIFGKNHVWLEVHFLSLLFYRIYEWMNHALQSDIHKIRKIESSRAKSLVSLVRYM